jgi:hypothetical protein
MDSIKPMLPNKPRRAAGFLAGLRDDEEVPLICPTCQRQLRVSRIDGGLLLCMGLFSIFLYRVSPP